MIKQLLAAGLFLAVGLNGWAEPRSLTAEDAAIATERTGGGYVHHLTGFEAPADVGSYYLMQAPTLFNDAGTDIAFRYKSRDQESEFTLYLTHTGGEGVSAEDWMVSAAASIMRRFQQDQPLGHGTVSAYGARPEGLYALFEVENTGQPYLTGVWTAKVSEWLLKVRFTMPSNRGALNSTSALQTPSTMNGDQVEEDAPNLSRSADTENNTPALAAKAFDFIDRFDWVGIGTDGPLRGAAETQ